jgi:exonuclease III
MGETLEIRALNVNGIQCKKKRDQVFFELTKYNNSILLLQETHSSALDEKYYKNKWGPNTFFSHGSTQSKGVCTIVPKNFKGTSEIVYADLEGRILIIKLILENIEYIVCNIYAPISSMETEQINTLNTLNLELAEYSNSNIIIGGDWNVFFDNFLDKKSKSKSTNICPNHKYRDLLKSMLEEMELSDCWRVAHPNKRHFTCRSGKHGEGVTQTRIDMIIVKDSLLNSLTNAKIEPGYRSDHNYTTISLNLNKIKRGKGQWKFNNNLLKDHDYVHLIKNLLETEIKENIHYEDKGFLWDYLKMRIRTETMTYSGMKHKLKRDELKQLTDEISKLDIEYMDNPTDNTHQLLETAKKELENHNKELLAGSVFRSKCEWAEHGEKNSKFFLNLEKFNYSNKNITMLEINKKQVTDEKIILSEIKNYYEKLYSSNMTDHTKMENILEGIPRLTDTQKSLTKGLITYDECLKSLKSMKNGKTPGLDGISADFYKFFWIDISDIVLNSINNAFLKNEMSTEQRNGLITLSPKKNKLRTLLKNWRPITLLTVDYKLLAKSLALRLKKILPEYIDESQFGYVKDRYIGENIRCVIDLNTYCEKEKLDAYAIQIDFEKAFDSVNWDFMFYSLEQMNFDMEFIKWVKILYKNTTSCVANNGHKTEVFNLRRGVHQGCPLSALLFIILVQVLQFMLYKNDNISGITIGSKEIKILQMADDTTIFTTNLQDIPKILKVLKIFYEISGLKTNIDKTVAYKLGKSQVLNFPENYLGLKWSNDPFNLLGITIAEDETKSIKENFTKRIESIELLTRIWCGRNLSLKGKLSVINSILIPKLIYPCTLLDVPQETIQQVSKIIKNFFWNWKRPKIKLDVLIRTIVKGGIKYPCFECKIKSWKTLWAIRALKFESCNPLWVKVIDALLPKGVTLCYLLRCKPNKKILDKYCPDLPKFYKNIILNWSEINDFPNILSTDTIKNECIWLNRNITINNQPLYNQNALTKHLWFVSDIIDEENSFQNHVEINRIHGTKCTFLDMLQCRLTLPHLWKLILIGEGPENKTDLLLYNKLHRYQKLKSKDIYPLILEHNHDCTSLPNTQLFWQNKYNLNIENMEILYKLPYDTTKRTNLQALQYKILHKIINCNYWLHKITIKDSPQCRFCREDETVEHYFFGCKITKSFWYAFQTWWNTNTCTLENIEIFYEKDIILGYVREDKKYKVLNCCILIGKSMIYNQKSMEKNPDIYKFHCELKEFLAIETQISLNCNQLDVFQKEWGEILNI